MKQIACPDGHCRCLWVNPRDPVYIAYHDNEWGKPVHEDRKLFEMLVLECFQAGLSWECILHKREAFRESFCGFDPAIVSQFSEEQVLALKNNPAIVRHEKKIRAAIRNASVFLNIQEEWKSFDCYLWHWTDRKSLHETGKDSSDLSDRISRDLITRGMQFVGTKTVYAYLQAVGLIQSHDPCCFLSD